ncbi:twin-arginine translocation signal domain-containing protein [Thalassoroseus pseudoceratinae]|uniref:twin-arginine translocation signal domain-containing protein n=1 Tax=Thalassoroseus pseudoceratinae TaxID=2713176 RepID=UPI0014226379|nr:twin-arginine translocation signal domain-containing protein [Thalassoroseus pseudoceratinae]
MTEEANQFSRRDVLKGGLAAPLALATGQAAQTSPATRSIIQQENARPGTTDWQLTRVRTNSGPYRTTLIEGYCSHQSIEAGDTLSIYVSTDPVRRFTIDIYRMGFYGGNGARHVTKLGPLVGETQPVPQIGPLPGRLRECEWSPAAEIKIPEDWVSGVYLGKLTTIPESASDPYWQSYIIFIVRDRRPAEILFQCSDNTWQAYNRWPVNESLYTHPDGAHAPGVTVSFDRPYGKYVQIFDHPLSIGSGEFLLWEYPLCYWLEQHGYDVTYGSNCDTMNPQFLTRCNTFLSVGHDEYWDVRQYYAAESAIQNGVNFLWLCGNSVFIDSPFTANSQGKADRRISRAGCYGPLRQDEIESYSSLFAGLQSTAPDERKIMGTRSVVPFNGGGDWTCTKPEHWVFQGTGMKRGDSIPGLVGWEHHGEPDPDRAGLEVLAEGPIWSGGVREGAYAATIFPGPKNNFVFNAASIFWSQGLSSPPGHILPWSHGSRPHGPDTRVQQVTRNLLDRAVANSKPS